MSDLNIIFHDGDTNKPLVIFIHGMGMDATFWAEPDKARVLGGKYPLSILLNGAELKTSFHDLMERNFPVVTWSQRRPSGPSQIAVSELSELIQSRKSAAEAGIILIGHSRGGLIARKYLQENEIQAKAIITIAAPHNGSSMAKWVSAVSPLTGVLKRMMDLKEKEVRSAMHRVLSFLSGEDLKEMLPGSDLLKSLSDKRDPAMRAISIAGTDPSLVKVRGVTLPQLLCKVLPDKILPDELIEGRGDGMVSADSAVYPGGDEHRNFHAHHAALIFNREVREYIIQKVIGLNA